MRTKTIAEHAADVLRETGNSSVGHGDDALLDRIADRSEMDAQQLSTKERRARILAALEISPLFSKEMVDIGVQQKGAQKVRRFTLIGPVATDIYTVAAEHLGIKNDLMHLAEQFDKEAERLGGEHQDWQSIYRQAAKSVRDILAKRNTFNALSDFKAASRKRRRSKDATT